MGAERGGYCHDHQPGGEGPGEFAITVVLDLVICFITGILL